MMYSTLIVLSHVLSGVLTISNVSQMKLKETQGQGVNIQQKDTQSESVQFIDENDVILSNVSSEDIECVDKVDVLDLGVYVKPELFENSICNE